MAMARKTRDRKLPQADFEISLEDAVGLLFRNQDVQPGDQWHFQVDGIILRITRIRAPEELPVDPSSTPNRTQEPT